MTAVIAPGICAACGEYTSRDHRCERRPGVEPAAHAAGMVHPQPVPGCPWCPPTGCPCGDGCADAGECRRRWGASETTWRQQAAGRGYYAGTALYGGGA